MKLRLSAWALIAANAVPLLGCLLFGWEPGVILALYWIESAIIGFSTWAKLLALPAVPLPKRLFNGAFFTVHFGIFMFVHGVFVAAFVFDGQHHFMGPEGVTRLPRVVFGTYASWGLMALVISHGVSYVQNFWLKERNHLDLSQVLGAPYVRIFTMHFTLILGFFAVALIGSSAIVVALLVALKTVVDLKAHERERRKASLPVPVTNGPADL